MDPSSYNVVYVDRRFGEDGTINHDDPNWETGLKFPTQPNEEPSDHTDLLSNINTIFAVFPQVDYCASGPDCVALLAEFANRNNNPTLLLIDIPWEEQPEEELPEDLETRHDSGYADILYGISLLRYVVAEMNRTRESRVIVPVAVICPKDKGGSKNRYSTHISQSNAPFSNDEQIRILKCLEIGAVDVLISPYSTDRAKALSVSCYKAALQKPKSKDSATNGQEEDRSKRARTGDYKYLKETMVSELMEDIVKRGKPTKSAASNLRISPNRLEIIKRAVGVWNFSAHDFTNEELLQCSVIMLEHALKMPEVEEFRMPTDKLIDFLTASREAYNDAIPYHNFRHVVDVLQACFCILLELGALPSFNAYQPTRPRRQKSPVAGLIRPVDALTLLISAIGHDAGHPGVNNAFLVNLKAPLAIVYNDRSVLESFHCAAFSQVLRKYWPQVQTPEFRKTMIEIILATDMGLHFNYMGQLDAMRKKLKELPEVTNWDEVAQAQHRTLLLSLIIKCADISNVARDHGCAAQWAKILIDEFSRQATMESDLGIPSALAVKPVTGSMLALSRSQVGFMTLFAIPLFENLTEVLPELQFSVRQLRLNIKKWQWKVKDCEQKDQPVDFDKLRDMDIPDFVDEPLEIAKDEPKSNGLLQEPKPSPSSLSNSRRSSALWSEDSDAEFGEETPRSSTGSPFPGRRNTNVHPHRPNGLTNGDDRSMVNGHGKDDSHIPYQERSPRLPTKNANGKNAADRRNASPSPYPPDSQNHTPRESSINPYQQSSNNLTVPNSMDDMRRPSSSPEFHDAVSEKSGAVVGTERMKRKSSRFFKAKLRKMFGSGKDQESG
ncbi:HD-domain/PDEase-like protein [Ascobolus immersus RN42]|uniref:HD-domain/PDEase-like protein n=1 Tax=Ascobolus immersus RN42 TaxID=1160509 RepID=A0A3N4I3C7_ASCIM|nr:HD-domain/PDEase-like protein [Ascobolus immersus RN42]